MRSRGGKVRHSIFVQSEQVVSRRLPEVAKELSHRSGPDARVNHGDGAIEHWLGGDIEQGASERRDGDVVDHGGLIVEPEPMKPNPGPGPAALLPRHERVCGW